MSTSSKFPEPPSDLVWIQTAFLGDVILNTGAFDLASRRFPGVKQHVVTTAVGASVLEGLDCIASTVTFDKRKIGFLAALKKVSRHLQENLSDSSRTVILQPHRSFRSSLLARFLGFPVATYFETNLGFFGRRVSRGGEISASFGVARRFQRRYLRSQTSTRSPAIRPFNCLANKRCKHS